MIGSPAKPESRWNQRQRSEHTAVLYDQIAEALDIPEMHVERTHVWRATLNSITARDGVPEAVRTAHLGHTSAVNRTRYTDLRDMAPLTARCGVFGCAGDHKSGHRVITPGVHTYPAVSIGRICTPCSQGKISTRPGDPIEPRTNE